MNVSFTLTNTGTRPILLTFPYSPTFDFSVKDFGGAIIYVWSWDKGYWPSVFECHLEPWQSMQATLSWTPDTPGVYTLTGYTEPFRLEGWEYGEWFRVRAKPIQFEVIG